MTTQLSLFEEYGHEHIFKSTEDVNVVVKSFSDPTFEMKIDVGLEGNAEHEALTKLGFFLIATNKNL